MVVHAWGTFTSLQDESGKAIGGINTDDEPALQFVHRVSDSLLISQSEVPSLNSKGGPLKLGRFRNALLLDEAKKRPAPNLSDFIHVYGLGGYTPATETAANAR